MVGHLGSIRPAKACGRLGIGFCDDILPGTGKRPLVDPSYGGKTFAIAFS
jgi:hypothetical protein